MKAQTLAILLILVIPLVVIANQPSTAAFYGRHDHVTDEPWTISQDLTIASQTLEVGRNITVENGATFTIKDSSLIFVLNGTVPYYNFVIEEGAALVVKNSRISASVEYLSFIMQCKGNVTILDSTISHLASKPGELVHLGGIMVMSNGTDIQRTNIYYGNVGVSLIDCHRITFKDNVINDTFIALSSEASEVTINGNVIRNTNYGIYDLDSDNVYENNHIYSASEPVYAFQSRSRFTKNTITDSQVGMVVISSENVTLDNNTLVNNNKAMQIVASTVDIIDNEIIGGIDGIILDYSEGNIISNTIYGQTALVVDVEDCNGYTIPRVQGMGSCIYLTLSDCLIGDNTLNNSNIGVYSYLSSPVIRGNRIHNMTDPVYSNATSCRVGENIIIYESIGLLGGLGISFRSMGIKTPVIKDNHITNNVNDGVFLWYSQPKFQNNHITDNQGYGIHALGLDIESSSGDTLSGNLEAFAFSIFKTFRFYDPYGDIVPYTEVKMMDLSTGSTYNLSTNDLPSFSTILLSYTAPEHRSPSQATEIHSYELTYNVEGNGDTTTYVAEPNDGQYTNLTVPIYRPDIRVNEVKVQEAFKGQQVKITAIIENIGDQVATNISINIYYTYQDESLYGESKVIKRHTIQSLGEGKTTEVVIFWTPEETGNYTIIVQADPERDLKEIREDNNQVEENVKVKEEDGSFGVIIPIILVILLAVVIMSFVGIYVLKKRSAVEAPQEEDPKPKGRRRR